MHPCNVRTHVRTSKDSIIILECGEGDTVLVMLYFVQLCGQIPAVVT